MDFAQFREVLRAIRRVHPYIPDYTTRELQIVVRQFVAGQEFSAFWQQFADGFLQKSGDRWRLTVEANQLSTKRLRRIKHATLERLKVELIERSKASGAQEVSPFEVGQLLFFGSAIGPTKDDYGDLDVVVRYVLKEQYKDMAEALASREEWQAYSYGPDAALDKYMRNRNGFIHLSDFWFVERHAIPYDIVYSVPDFEGRLKR